MIEGILIPFGAVALAELGDKTQLSILLLSSKTQKHLNLFLGVMLAFLLVDGAAILLGSWLHGIIRIDYLKIGAGIIFIIFGLLMLWKSKNEEGESKLYSKNVFLSGFLLILITELGDKTQLASGLMATKYNGFYVLIGTMAALMLLSMAAIFLGKFISTRLNKRLIGLIAGIVFVLMGVSFFIF